MRLTPQEEFGLRCLLAVCKGAPESTDPPVSIERIAEGEGIGYEHAAKVLRLLRRGGLVLSTRGVNGGYHLARPADQITVWDTLMVLDAPLVDGEFCTHFKGRLDACTHASTHCTLKGLWSWVGHSLEQGLGKVTLEDLKAGRQPGRSAKELM